MKLILGLLTIMFITLGFIARAVASQTPPYVSKTAVEKHTTSTK